MGSLLLVAAAACAVLVAAVVGLTLAVLQLRRDLVRLGESQHQALEAMRTDLAALAARAAVIPETTHETPDRAAEGAADYVIAFDEQPEPVPASRVAVTALGEPLIKVAAFGHGVRRALRPERRAYVAYEVRRDYRRRRRASRARMRQAR